MKNRKPCNNPEPEAGKGFAPSVVILKSHRLAGDLIRHQVWETWADAPASVFQKGFDALASIQEHTPDLFITGVKIDGMDGLEHLEPFIETDLSVLIVTCHHDARTFDLLREIRYDGLYDSVSEGIDNLGVALRQVLQHRIYVSPSMVSFLHKPRNVTLDVLTDKEQVVLSVIGDGTDDVQASLQLGIASGTVNSHRKSIMGKLNLHHRGELMLYAMQQGYIRVTPHGVSRPGFQRRIEEIVRAKRTKI